ncbi:class I SAM-dependent methyltransferase [Faecalimicrobium sp. JNUCC 81]
MLDNKGFDIWSKEYDESVEKSSNEYPFDGYYNVLNYVYNLIKSKEDIKLFDIGFGTGLLTNKLYSDGANIYGIDFSQGMIDIAQKKMPNGKFIKWDFSLGIPSQLEKERFDYIISSYAIHHLDNDKKVEFVSKLKDLLNENGKIIIADIAFKTEDELINCKDINSNKWDEDEIYMVEEKIVPQLFNKGIHSTYTQISSCAGILEIH